MASPWPHIIKPPVTAASAGQIRERARRHGAHPLRVPEQHPGLRGLAPFRQGKSTLDDHVNPIKLSANESHHGPSPLAVEAYRNHSGQLFRYPDGAQSQLRRAIAETFGLRVQGIVCGNGSDELLQLLIRAYVRPGDDVVFSRHSLCDGVVHATAQGARIVMADEPELRPDTDALLAGDDAADRAVIIASPNNPVGRYLPRAELERLRRGLPAETVLIVDAAYADYVDAEDFEPGQALVERGLQHRDDPHVLQALRTRGAADRLDVRAGQHRRRRRAHPHAVQRVGGRDGCGGRGGARRALHAVRPRLQYRALRRIAARRTPWAAASSS